MAIMSHLAHTKSPFLSPDTNPLLRTLLKATFYAQFCAGETRQEVHRTIASLKTLGYKGVILNYAKEVVLSPSEKAALKSSGPSIASVETELKPWANGTLETVRLTSEGDFVALKFSGAGSQALYSLTRKEEPLPEMKRAIDEICDLAVERGVKLLFDAENDAIQPGIDAWTLQYMKRYNDPSRAVVYGTYQAYLKSCPQVLAEHLAFARKNNIALGVKLVRGAYIGSDPRHLIHDTKADTDACYDGIAEALVKRQYTPALPAAEGEIEFPAVEVVLAGHNHDSVRRVQKLQAQQAVNGEKRTEMVYAQLQGMADDVSCEIVQAGREAENRRDERLCGNEKFSSNVAAGEIDIPKAYKYVVWGTTGECMKYLMRRAQENKDALGRTREGRDAMAKELLRRMRTSLRF
ncbi:FAD-linked oxidoreductase-like protein [Bisporella sp. PMI_857]|nr:FAD-linked oxidoreductase-like protein [Bisporella sp. PMI_857]